RRWSGSARPVASKLGASAVARAQRRRGRRAGGHDALAAGMMRKRLPNAAAVAATLLAGIASGCISFTGPASALRPVPRDSLPRWQTCDSAPHCTAEVRLTYLGVAGFLIRAGAEAVMTAPSFTHPSIWAVATPFWPIHSDSQTVDHELRRLLGKDTAVLG